jgi:uncharacterized radical SAM superfamily protein
MLYKYKNKAEYSSFLIMHSNNYLYSKMNPINIAPHILINDGELSKNSIAHNLQYKNVLWRTATDALFLNL